MHTKNAASIAAFFFLRRSFPYKPGGSVSILDAGLVFR